MPKFGEVRIIKRFLFLPLTIKNKTLWFKTVYIKQSYFVEITRYEEKIYWKNLEFLTEKEYLKWNTGKDL